MSDSTQYLSSSPISGIRHSDSRGLLRS